MAKSKTTPMTKMTKDAASRIQSSTAKQNGGKVSKSTFAAKAQRVAERNEG